MLPTDHFLVLPTPENEDDWLGNQSMHLLKLKDVYNWFPIEHVGEVSKIVILGFQGSCTSLFCGASPVKSHRDF